MQRFLVNQYHSLAGENEWLLHLNSSHKIHLQNNPPFLLYKLVRQHANVSYCVSQVMHCSLRIRVMQAQQEPTSLAKKIWHADLIFVAKITQYSTLHNCFVLGLSGSDLLSVSFRSLEAPPIVILWCTGTVGDLTFYFRLQACGLSRFQINRYM